MPTFGTIKAFIKVDSENLPEYDVQTDETERKVTCWIPSETSKHFSVCWQNTDTSVDTLGCVALDGVVVGGRITFKGWQTKQEYAREYTSSTTCRYFSFAPITYTDDDAYLGAPAPNFGEIRLTVWRVEIGQAGDMGRKNIEPQASKVHETSKKVGAHRVQFSEEVEAVPETFWSSKKLEILAVFIFRYCPLGMLQARGVAPLPPRAEAIHPSREGAKRKYPEVIDINDDSSDDSEDVEVRLIKLKAQLRSLEARGAKKRKVKTEKSDRPLVINEVIDLT